MGASEESLASIADALARTAGGMTADQQRVREDLLFHARWAREPGALGTAEGRDTPAPSLRGQGRVTLNDRIVQELQRRFPQEAHPLSPGERSTTEDVRAYVDKVTLAIQAAQTQAQAIVEQGRQAAQAMAGHALHGPDAWLEYTHRTPGTIQDVITRSKGREYGR